MRNFRLTSPLYIKRIMKFKVGLIIKDLGIVHYDQDKKRQYR